MHYKFGGKKHTIDSKIDDCNLISRLEIQFPTLQKHDDDAFEELIFEMTKQRKSLKIEKLPWIPYHQLDATYKSDDCGYMTNDYSAIWKNGHSKDQKVLLLEIMDSSHHVKEDLVTVNKFQPLF